MSIQTVIHKCIIKPVTLRLNWFFSQCINVNRTTKKVLIETLQSHKYFIKQNNLEIFYTDKKIRNNSV